ncbi:MAG: tetratricopeptide repeat protein [Myxococcota bacterium]
MAEDELTSQPPPSGAVFDFDEGSISTLLDHFVEAHTGPQRQESSRPPDAEDAGAQAAHRTIFEHAPREERMPLVGDTPEALRRRISLIEALAASASGSAEARLWTSAGELHERLGDLASAGEAYRRALSSDARDVVALRALRRHARARRDWDSMAGFLAQEAALDLGPDERATALELLAQVHLARTGDTAAAEHAARDAASLTPGSFCAHLTVALACFARGDSAGAGQAIANAAEGWPDDDARAALLQHAGALTEQAGDIAAARSLYQRASALDPNSLPAQLGLIRADYELGDLRSCVATLEELAGRVGGPVLAAGLTRMAAVVRAWAGDPAADIATRDGGDALHRWTDAGIAAADGDLDALVDALRPQPDDDDAVRAIDAARSERIHAERREAPQISATDLERIEAHGLTNYFRASQRLRGEDDGSELRWLIEALNVAPESVPADMVNADGAALLGDGAALVAALGREVERAADPTGPALALAEISEELDPESRAQSLRADSDPLVLRAFTLAAGPEDAPSVAEAWRQEGRATPGQAGVFASTMAGRLHQRANRLSDAIKCFEEATQQQVDYWPALWALEDGPFDDATRQRSAVAQADIGAPDASDAWLRASFLTTEREEQLLHLEAARPTTAQDPILAEALVRALGPCAQPTAEVLLSSTHDPASVRISRAATALLTKGDSAGAARELRALAEREPDDIDVRTLCEDAEIRAGEYARVATSMMRRVREATQEADELAALADMVMVDRLVRRDRQSARLSLQSVAERVPDHLPTARALEWDALYMNDGERIMSSAKRMLGCLAEESHEHAARRRLMVEVLTADPDILAHDVDRLLTGTNDDIDADPGLARRVVGMAYARGEDETTLRALASLQAHLPSELERSAIALERAHVLERRGEPERALAILSDASDHPLGLALEAELLAAAERWDEATACFERAATHAKDGRRAASLWRAAAQLFEEKLDDTDSAVRTYVAAAGADITYLDVYRRLLTLYQRLGRSTEAEALTDARIDAGADTPNLVALLLEQASQRRSRGDLDGVVSALHECLDLDPHHFGALTELVDTHRQRKDWQGAAEGLIRIARLKRSPDEQVWAFSQLAELYELQLEDAPRAEAALRQVLKLAPTRAEAHDQLARVLRIQGKAVEAAKVLDGLVRRSPTGPARTDYAIRLAAAVEAAGQPRQAEQYLENLRAEHPTDLDLVLALTDHFERQGTPAAASMHLNRALADVRDAIDADPEDGELWTTIVRILGRRHGPGPASCAASAAIALGHPAALFEGAVDERGRTLGTPQIPIDSNVDRITTPKELPATLLRVFEMCEQGFEKLLPLDSGGWKLRRVPTSMRALHGEASQVAKALGLGEPKLRIASGSSTVCMPISGQPMTIAIGEQLTEVTSERERVFLLARALKIASLHLAPALRAQPSDLDAVLLALLGTQEASRAQRPPPTQADDLRRTLVRSVPRRSRNDLEGLILELRGDQGFSSLAVPMAIAALGNQVALTLTGDVPSAVTALLRASGEPVPEIQHAKLAVIRDTPEVWNLIRFALSNAHFEARAQAGVDR